MTVHVLTHHMQTGTPILETYASMDHVIAAGAQHRGQVIRTTEDLVSLKKRYAQQGLTLSLLDTINPDQLEQ